MLLSVLGIYTYTYIPHAAYNYPALSELAWSPTLQIYMSILEIIIAVLYFCSAILKMSKSNESLANRDPGTYST